MRACAAGTSYAPPPSSARASTGSTSPIDTSATAASVDVARSTVLAIVVTSVWEVFPACARVTQWDRAKRPA